MTKRTPAQYDWTKALFNDRRLSKHFTSPRRSKIKTVTLHHMTIVAPGDGSGSTVALEGCYRTWQTRQASANYGVSGDQVWQYVSDNDAAWANAHTSNHETLSIEHANSTAAAGGWKVSDKTLETGARLVATLHRLYGLGRPSRKTVKMHRDYFATACPGPNMVARLNDYIAAAAHFYDQSSETKPPTTKPPVDNGATTYTVRPGDTLSAIAKKFGVTVANLTTWNGIKNADKIAVGQKLTVAKPSTPKPPPSKPKPLAFWLLQWNIYGPNHGDVKGGAWRWAVRSARVQGVLKSASCSVFALSEVNTNPARADLDAALGTKTIKHVPTVALNDAFYTASKFTEISRREVHLGDYQNRKALVLHLERDGKRFHLVNTHLASGDAKQREAQGRALGKLVDSLSGPVVVTGDLNNATSYKGSPRQVLEAAGFKASRDQAAIKNAGDAQHVSFGEKPKPGHWIADVYTRGCKVTAGELLPLPANTSDHRPIKVRIEIP